MQELPALAAEQYCYLTTAGRRTGNPHTVELWFAAPPAGRPLYILAGGGLRADWVRNLQQTPAVIVRLGNRTFAGQGRLVTTPAEDHLARRLVVAKYYGRTEVATAGWEATALPVAIDLSSE
jgi:deazaflavin-dependent oxidoreductase (nitroreductase family)